MGDLLADRTRASAMAVEGRRHAQQLLDVRQTAAQVAAIYLQIVEARRRVAAGTAAVPVGAES